MCAFNNLDTTERVVSESDTFTITAFDTRVTEGKFDMLMKGSVSEKI